MKPHAAMMRISVGPMHGLQGGHLLVQERQEEQSRRIERLEQQVAALRKEKGEVEAHADVLEKALMKLSMEKAQVQVRPEHALLRDPRSLWGSLNPSFSPASAVSTSPADGAQT